MFHISVGKNVIFVGRERFGGGGPPTKFLYGDIFKWFNNSLQDFEVVVKRPFV
jgi:hypothetical protein